MLLNKLKKKRAGFTLIEVLVAVAILGLVAAGALRLMIISTKSLTEVQEAREMLDFARKTQLEFFTDKTKPTSGVDEKFRWNARDSSWPILGDMWEIRYRELTIETDKGSVILYIPAS